MKRNSSLHYHQQMAAQQMAAQRKPRAIARTQSQNREATQRRLRFLAIVSGSAVFFLWQLRFLLS